jgi:hypothetical protein
MAKFDFKFLLDNLKVSKYYFTTDRSVDEFTDDLYGYVAEKDREGIFGGGLDISISKNGKFRMSRKHFFVLINKYGGSNCDYYGTVTCNNGETRITIKKSWLSPVLMPSFMFMSVSFFVILSGCQNSRSLAMFLFFIASALTFCLCLALFTLRKYKIKEEFATEFQLSEIV